MVEKFIILITINALFILGLNNAANREYVIGRLLRTINIEKNLKEVLFNCVTCMPSFWGTIFYLFFVHNYTDSVFYYFILIYIPILSIIVYSLRLILNLLIKKITE